MPARRKVSTRQLELLLEFGEAYPNIALGRPAGGPLGNQSVRQSWEAIALNLNAVAEGTTKSPEQWRRYWIEYKAKVKNKAADLRRQPPASGRGPNRLLPLSEIEQRVLALMGPVAVKGLPAVRIPFAAPTTEEAPFAAPTTEEAEPVVASQHSSENHSSLKIEEWVKEEMSPDIPELAERPISEHQSPHRTHAPAALPRLSQTHVSVHQRPHGTQAAGALPRLSQTNVSDRQRTLVRGMRGPSQRQVHQSSQGTQSPARRERRLSQAHVSGTQSLASGVQRPSRIHVRRNERIPQWAYDLELRRIAVEERHAAALEALVATVRGIADTLTTNLFGSRE